MQYYHSLVLSLSVVQLVADIVFLEVWKQHLHIDVAVTFLNNGVTIYDIHQNTYNLGKPHQKYSILQCYNALLV